MIKNSRYMIIFLALLIAGMSVAVAADIDDTASVSSDVSDAVEVDTTSTVDTQAVASVSEDNNQKIIKETKSVKSDENDPVIVTNDGTGDNFDTLFTVVSPGVHQIKSEYSGKTIKINTDITRNEHSYIINVPITLTSDYNNTIDLNTSNGYEPDIIEHWTSINFTSGASLSGSSKNMKSDSTVEIVDQYSLHDENDLTIYSNGTAVIVLSKSNVISVVFRGLTNAYTTKLNELNYEITDLVIYVNASPGNYAEVPFTMNNQENINLFVISNPSFTFKGLKVSGNWKTITYENLKIVQSFTDNTKGQSALGLVGNNITLKNCTYTFTCPGDLVGICNSENFIPIVEGETAKASAIYIVGENINVEECKFTISQQPYMHTDEVNIDLGGGNVFHMDANDWHVYSMFFYHSKNVTFCNNTFTIDSMEKDSSMSIYQYSPIFAGNVTELNLINNEINVRYVPGMNLTTNDTLIENNTIFIMNGDYTINLIGDNNIVHYNTLITELAEGDATVITTGNNNVVEQNPYVEVVEPVLKVDTTEFSVGSTTTISASIYYGDEVANDINKGKVSFKVNGKTLKDENGKVIYAKVIGGVATIEGYEIPQDWAKEGTTIQAVYSGSGDIGKLSSDKETITVTSQQPTITIEDVQATVGSTVTLTATVTAATPINNGKVVFKINGKTVKDASGKVIYVKVVNGQVNVNYIIPEDMEAKDYIITAVFISNDYGRIEDSKTLTVTSSEL